MLHDVQLPEPCLVERVASRVDDVTQSILLRQDEHSVQQALHRVCRPDQRRELVCLIHEEHGHLLHRRCHLLLQALFALIFVGLRFLRLGFLPTAPEKLHTGWLTRLRLCRRPTPAGARTSFAGGGQGRLEGPVVEKGTLEELQQTRDVARLDFVEAVTAGVLSRRKPAFDGQPVMLRQGKSLGRTFRKSDSTYFEPPSLLLELFISRHFRVLRDAHKEGFHLLTVIAGRSAHYSLPLLVRETYLRLMYKLAKSAKPAIRRSKCRTWYLLRVRTCLNKAVWWASVSSEYQAIE